MEASEIRELTDHDSDEEREPLLPGSVSMKSPVANAGMPRNDQPSINTTGGGEVPVYGSVIDVDEGAGAADKTTLKKRRTV